MTTTTHDAQRNGQRPRSVRFAGHLGKCPCGRKCILRADTPHFYCTCSGACELCHDPQRFGRATQVQAVTP